MDAVVRLAASEVVAGRPFSHPDRTLEDLTAIGEMREGLRHRLAGRPAGPPAPRPLVFGLPGREGRQHRAVVCDEAQLREGRDLALVGFFAEKRRDRDCSPLTAMDDELIVEFPAHPGILSYSSLELSDGDWGNLILLDSSEARERWRESAKHAYAAGELAPQYYSVVRLHRGTLPGGLLSGRDPVLLQTRYLDFQGPAAWRAERELRPV